MAKIWEVDFTKFNPPASDNAVDNIGTEDLTAGTNIIKGSLPGFTYRPGVIFDQDNAVASRYTFSQSTHPSAVFTGSFSARSFVMWYYAIGDGPWENRSALWGNNFGFSTPQEGWNVQLGNLNLFVSNTLVATYPSSFSQTAGWKLVVCTIDKNLGQTRGFGRSSVEDFDTGIFAGVSNNSEVLAMMVGDSSTSREISASIAYMATYDHILSLAEIDAIEAAFLRDSVNGETAVADLTGLVIDEAFNTVSGADVTLFNNDLNLLVAQDITTSSGTYSVDVPYYGNYTVTASHPPNTGAIAAPFIVTGISGSPGVITWLGGS